MTKTYILVHGSWHNGECWKKVRKILEDNGHKVFCPTLTGMKSVKEPAERNVGLKTHVQDILNLIEENNIEKVILVGHSYAGVVITEVANTVPEKISHLVYLDAFIPETNKSLFDISNPERVEAMKKALVDDSDRTAEDGAQNPWLLPSRSPEFFGVTEQADIEWLNDNLVYTPVLTMEEKVNFDPARIADLNRSYIRCTKAEILAKLEGVAKSLGMNVYRIDAEHDAMVTAPEEVSKILLDLDR
jgi:pimeloyl-ACP methyl ester carboxylesterase